ncbi:MAG: hypothetical protein N3F05_02775 [Candidatus Diapherotrites archaeon]|nr:hypothetical protein [Candidatus Diapherotrites archaeon]
MKKLIMAVEGERKRFALLRNAFEQKGFSVKLLPVRRLTLFADRNGSKAKIFGNGKFDGAVYLETPFMLTQFVEPLLDYIETKGFYCQVHKGAYYVGSNELLQISLLSSYGIKIPYTRIFGNIEQIRKAKEKFSYPVVVKVYKNGEKIQSMIAKNSDALASLTERIEGDTAVVSEFIEGDIEHCAVIGEEVFALRSTTSDPTKVRLMKNAVNVKLSKTEEETAIQAASICGCDIATVKMCRGFVTRVKPHVNMILFTKKTGRNLFEKVAELFYKKSGGG